MRSGTSIIEQRDIVLIPFPFTDLSATKKRPALVISYTDFNNENQDILVCQITHNLKQRKHSIYVDNNNLIDKSLIIQKIGKLSSKTYSMVYDEICKLTKPR